MTISFHKLQQCTATKHWGNTTPEVVCNNGLLLLFNRENGCNEKQLKQLARETIDQLAKEVISENAAPLVVIVAYYDEAYYKINWLLYAHAKVIENSNNRFANDGIEYYEPKHLQTVQLHIDASALLNDLQVFQFVLIETALGIDVQTFLSKYPLSEYPLPTAIDISNRNCFQKMYAQLKFYLSKQPALQQRVTIIERVEWLMYDYDFTMC